MKNTGILLMLFTLLLPSCRKSEEIRMVPISTPSGTFNVWTKRFGDNPHAKVLLLHGAGGTHEQFECFERFFRREGIEFYEYDQLGSYYSDQPNDTSLWNINRMVDEVEQVRKALGLNRDNFFLLGHAWGGMLAMQYALKYQDNLKGLIVCNAYSNAYNQNLHLMRMVNDLEPDDTYDIAMMSFKRDLDNPRYKKLEYLMYKDHKLLLSPTPEPLARQRSHMNIQIDTIMNGRGISVGGRLAEVNIREDLAAIKTPTLMVGARQDIVDWDHMRHMSEVVQHGQFLLCEKGSHNAMWDDQKVFMDGVISFIKSVRN